MKKFFLPVLCLCVMVSAFFYGFQAALAQEEEEFTQQGLELILADERARQSMDVLKDALLADDTLYLLTQTRLHAYQPHSGGYTHLFTLGLPPYHQGVLAADPSSYYRLFYWQEGLYALNIDNGEGYLFDFEKGTLGEIPAFQLPFNQMEPREKRLLPGIFGDELFIIASDWGFEENNLLYSFNLTNYTLTPYQTPGVCYLFDGGEGHILAAVNQPTSKGRYLLGTLDLKKDAFAPWGDFSPPLFQAPAYDKVTGTLYYVDKHQLYRCQQDQAPAPAAYLGYYGEEKAFINPQGDLYMMFRPGQGVMMVDLALAAKAQPLKVSGAISSNMLDGFQKAHPGVHLETSLQGPYVTPEELITQSLLNDILVETLPSPSFRGIMEKGYAYPLSTAPALAEKLSQMYPYIVNALSYNGHTYAIPVDLSLSIITYHQRALEAIGLTEEDLPTTYKEYLTFILRWQEELAEQNPDYFLFVGDLNPDVLLNTIIDGYIASFTAKGILIDFDTPLFKDMMVLFKAIDFNYPMGQHSPNRADLVYALFNPYGLPGNSSTATALLPLAINEGDEPFYPLKGKVLFINPYTQNPDGALAFMEYYVNHYPQNTLPLYYPNEKEPVEATTYKEEVANLENLIAKEEERLPHVDEKDRAPTQERITLLTKSLADTREYRWAISPQAITYYQSLAPYLTLDTRAEQKNSSFTQLVEDFLQDKLSLDQFISQGNRVFQMMALEGE